MIVVLLGTTLSLHGVYGNGTMGSHLWIKVGNEAGIVLANWRARNLIEVALRGSVRRGLDLEVSCSVRLVLE